MKEERENLVLDDKFEEEVFPTEFTEVVGGNGRWQIWLLVLVTVGSIPSAYNHLGMIFLATPQDHWCTRYNDSGLSLEKWWADNLPNASIKGLFQHSQCEQFIDNRTFRSVEKCASWEYSSGFKSIVQRWDLVCDKEWMISLSQSVYMLGFLFTSIISGQLADLYGRYPVILANSAILTLAAFSTTLSTSFLFFTIARFFVGVGQAGVSLVLHILFFESIGECNRAQYSFIHGIGWHIGNCTLALFAWLSNDWITLQIIIAISTLFYATFYWLLQESPRWLLTRGNFSKTLTVMEAIARRNKRNVPDLEVKVNFWIKSIKVNDVKTQATVFDLLRTSNLRRRTLCLYFIWVSIAFVYYGISLNTNSLQGNIYINFLLSGLSEIPSTFFCMLTVDRFGRRKTFIFTLIGAGVTCLSFIFVSKELWQVQTTLAMIGKFFTSSSFHIVYLYSSELFPTVARNVGVGSCSTIARIGSSVAPFMKDLGNYTSTSLPYVLYGSLSVISGLLVLQLPETNNCPVPETLQQAENFTKSEKASTEF